MMRKVCCTISEVNGGHSSYVAWEFNAVAYDTLQPSKQSVGGRCTLNTPILLYYIAQSKVLLARSNRRRTLLEKKDAI